MPATPIRGAEPCRRDKRCCTQPGASCSRSAVAAMLGCGLAGAGCLSARPIRLVVGFAAGGSTDIPARYVADKLGALLGQRVIVENKPAAAGMLATRDVLAQPRDGYNLLLCTHFESINAAVYRNAQFELADLAPISLIAKYYYGLALSNAVPATDLAAFVRYAKAHPGEISYATIGSRIGAGDLCPAARAPHRHHHEQGSLSRRRPGPAGFASGARAVLRFADVLDHPAGERRSAQDTRGFQSGTPRGRAAGAHAAGTGRRFRPVRLARAFVPRRGRRRTSSACSIARSRPSSRRRTTAAVTERAGSIPASSTPDELREIIAQTRIEVEATIQEFGLQQE